MADIEEVGGDWTDVVEDIEQVEAYTQRYQEMSLIS
jgi:hypothetical protein